MLVVVEAPAGVAKVPAPPRRGPERVDGGELPGGVERGRDLPSALPPDVRIVARRHPFDSSRNGSGPRLTDFARWRRMTGTSR